MTLVGPGWYLCPKAVNSWAGWWLWILRRKKPSDQSREFEMGSKGKMIKSLGEKKKKQSNRNYEKNGCLDHKQLRWETHLKQQWYNKEPNESVTRCQSAHPFVPAVHSSTVVFNLIPISKNPDHTMVPLIAFLGNPFPLWSHVSFPKLGFGVSPALQTRRT